MVRWGWGHREIHKQREGEKDKDKQDCKIVIIAHTNEKLITPQLTMSSLYYLRLHVGGTMQHQQGLEVLCNGEPKFPNCGKRVNS